MTTMKLETPRSVIWKKCENKIRRALKQICFWYAIRPPLSFDRLSHWWSTEKECLFDFFPFIFVGWLLLLLLLEVGGGGDFNAYTAPMKINLCKAFVV